MEQTALLLLSYALVSPCASPQDAALRVHTVEKYVVGADNSARCRSTKMCFFEYDNTTSGQIMRPLITTNFR